LHGHQPKTRTPPTAVIALLVLGLAARAGAVTVEIEPDEPGCGPYTAGVGACDVSARPSGQITVTWALDTQTTLNGYDFEVRWDAGELTLVSAEQLHPDTATPLSFVIEPSDPDDSRALVLSLTGAFTKQLFRLTFELDRMAADGQADVSWFANGNGLSPGSVVLDNLAGAGIDFDGGPDAVPVPGLRGVARMALGLGLGLAGATRARMRRERREGAR